MQLESNKVKAHRKAGSWTFLSAALFLWQLCLCNVLKLCFYTFFFQCRGQGKAASPKHALACCFHYLHEGPHTAALRDVLIIFDWYYSELP